jgi:hypothetical protein
VTHRLRAIEREPAPSAGVHRFHPISRTIPTMIFSYPITDGRCPYCGELVNPDTITTHDHAS